MGIEHGSDLTAGELRIGDEIVMNDWHLHVRNVVVDDRSVMFTVEEFPEIVHHRAVDAVIGVRVDQVWRPGFVRRGGPGTGRPAASA